MRSLFLSAAALISGLLMSQPAAAHFQLIYTPEVNVEAAGTLPVKLIFWHPMENGPAMDMGQPEQFFVVHRGEKTDLKPTLKPITFKGTEGSAKAFAGALTLKRSGDYIMVAVPAPYLEKSEDVFIQQITKSFVNRSGLPTDWNTAIGLPAEIVPLNKPTNVIAGSTFSGQVLSDGKPVAGAEIEVEYIAALPDMQGDGTAKPTTGPLPGGSLVAITDANGVFTFGVPKAGFWGFAALGVGPATSYQNKKLSQDAVIWVRAYDLPGAP